MSTEEVFSPEQMASERAARRAGINQPTYTDLVAHMKRFGPEGIVESAAHLDEDQLAKLMIKAKKMKLNKQTKKWE